MSTYFFIALASTAFAGHHGSSKKVDESIFKKSETSNQCFLVQDSLSVECPIGYDFVSSVEAKKGMYEYCESVMVELPVPKCPVPSVEIHGGCYVQECEHVCPEGFQGNSDKKKSGSCYNTEIVEPEEVCPFMYTVFDSKKGGKYCKAMEEVVTVQCPENTKEIHGVCFGTEEVFPGTCPEGFEPTQDPEFCSRTVERECEEKKGKKSDGHHHRRLQHHNNSHHGSDYHYVPVDHSEGHHNSHHDDIKVKAPKVKAPKMKKVSEPKKSAYGFTKLIEESYCTYEEFVPATPVFIDIIVEHITTVNDIVKTAPVDYVCPMEFDLSFGSGKKKKSDEVPVCIKSRTAAPVCPYGTVAMDDCCVTEMNFEDYCPPGTLPDEGFCVSSEIVPPHYRWVLERECEGFECRKYYESSCVTAHHH